MSIEKDLTRIADALEILVAQLSPGGKSGEPKPVKEGKKTVAIVEDVPPGITDDPLAGALPEPTVLGPSLVKTPDELRAYGQKYLAAFGDKGPAFIGFIQGLCKKLNPKDPKLMKVPADQISTAAQAIYDFAMKNNIVID